jgi:predicted DNA-binding protein (MmcQ/YjbR family)
MITLHDIRRHCLAKAGTTEELPFDDVTLVYKVAGKMFALVPSDTGDSVTLKCDPETALERRAEYESVQGAYHMNKKHWISVALDGVVPRAEVFRWVDDSYNLVVAALPKAKRVGF